MSEFTLQLDYSRKGKKKFFHDKEPKEYHGFLVLNPENIPNKYLYFAKKTPCLIWISDDLVKKVEIDFGNSNGAIKNYRFVINLGEGKVAKFNTNNSNQMVLKTKEYFENTVKKIGFWNSQDYFYELDNKKQKKLNSSANPENKSEWGKIILICLPIIIFVGFIFWIVKWMSKKNK